MGVVPCPAYFGALKGEVQRYAWGKVGKSSRIAAFVPSCSPEEPLAEYWLGAHPKGPAELSCFGGIKGRLDSLVASDSGGFLGDEIRAEFGGHLPFLLKVLSINPDYGLSIQAHPDKELAEKLHARDPLNYPDSNHKPEVAVALSPLHLLYGFRSLPDIARNVLMYPELQGVFSRDTLEDLKRCGDSHKTEAVLLKQVYRESLTAAPEVVSTCVAAIARRFEGLERVPEEVALLQRLRPRYGDSDVGLLALLVMNIATVMPGQALFIGPNVAHAYLEGDLVECMACSDNVVRAGLTPKFKDVHALIEMLDYRASPPAVLSLASEPDGGFVKVDATVRDFCLEVSGSSSCPLVISGRNSPAMVLCLGGQVVVTHQGSGTQLQLNDGGAFFIPPGSDEYHIERQTAALFYVTCGSK